jgi:hypothetical protein
MKAVLGGTLENAMIRQMTVDADPSRLNTTHGYYRSLQRDAGQTAFSRAATVLSIADSVLFPKVDWTSSMLGKQAPAAAALGWVPFDGEEMWKEDWLAFCETAFEAGAFTGLPLKRLGTVPPVPGAIDTPEDIRSFSVHHLMRLLLQLDAAEKGRALLFLPKEDEEILVQLSDFALLSSHRPPLDLPDFETARRDPEARSVTLLAFQPPDASSIIPVRSDLAVRRYAERVMALWDVPDPIEREQAAVRAMREVIRADEVRGWAAAAFDAFLWVLKPLVWGGVPLISAVADARDIADVAREREREARNWLLIRTMMNDISLENYLKRMDNV